MVRTLAAILCLCVAACTGGAAGEPSGPDALAITPGTLANGTVGTFYSAVLKASGGSQAGYTWRIAAGALPTGLGGLPASGDTTTIVGTPDNAGPWSVTVELSDSLGASARVTYSINIAPAGGGGGGSDTSLVGAPSPRAGHTAVWAGDTMIVWGGMDNAGLLGDGAAYNPATDTWRALPASGAPAPRIGHTAIWTGSLMIVWGGSDSLGPRSDGFAYSPTNNQWTPIGTGGPAVRGHTATWTGSRMVVWGGRDAFALTISTVNVGGQYDPTADTWSATSLTAAPSARTAHTAVWSGAEVVVWGGLATLGTVVGSGRRYTPLLDRWVTMAGTFAPVARMAHTAIWTGNQMVVWGGADAAGTPLGTGGTYAPGTNRWAPLPLSFTPAARTQHSAVWTGSEMIVWGGRSGTTLLTYLQSGGRLTP